MKCLGCCLGENLEEEKLVEEFFSTRLEFQKVSQHTKIIKFTLRGIKHRTHKKNEPTHYASHVFWDDLKINRKTEKSFIG
jgi:hypothetical protein